MRNITRNTGYFLSEIKTIFFLNGFSGILSIISLMLIFFTALLAISGWMISVDLVDTLKSEAEISVYYSQDASEDVLRSIEASFGEIDGIKSFRNVSAGEAYDMMAEILGEEADALLNFEENPFEAYYEINIDSEKLEDILILVREIGHIEYVRDNQSILDKLNDIVKIITAVSILAVLAVAAATFIITLHIIRESVHAHRRHISTLRLLGAPSWFVNTPFAVEGTLVTFLAGVLSIALYIVFARMLGRMAGETLPFLPELNFSGIKITLVIGMAFASLLLGLASSLLGLKLIKGK
ncbi:MAG: FtsX-like permease family protein [Clostridia bacterium]|nr:FtsX-like permease family protein [Clostridia bacterium]